MKPFAPPSAPVGGGFFVSGSGETAILAIMLVVSHASEAGQNRQMSDGNTITLNIGGQQATMTRQHLEQTLAQQRAGWHALASKFSSNGAAQQICHRARGEFQELEGSAKGSATLEHLRQHGERLFLRYPAVGSAQWDLINRAADLYGATAAEGALNYFLVPPGQKQNANHELCGTILGILLDERVPFANDLAPIAELKREWEEKLNEMKGRLEYLETEKRASLESLERAYEQIRTLDEPAHYWDSKRKWNVGLSAAFLIAFLLAGVFGGWALISASQTVRDAVLQGSGEPNVWEVIPRAFPVILGGIGLFWLLRILARNFFQQAHLAADASERVAMVNTYLSMRVGKGTLEGKPAFDDKDHAILLSQLFRPGPAAGSDDAAPPIPWSWFTKDKP